MKYKISEFKHNIISRRNVLLFTILLHIFIELKKSEYFGFLVMFRWMFKLINLDI